MQLLISVVNEKEAIAALNGGANIIDVKNPMEGALGASFPKVIKGIREVVPQDIPVSASIGDAPDLPGLMSLAALGAAACNIQYIKVGLYGFRSTERATKMLMEIKRAANGYDKNIRIIAVAYGDASKINAISPLEAIKAAIKAGIEGCMLDTATKGEGNLFSFQAPEDLSGFVLECRKNNLISALAGSLNMGHIPVIKEIGPDIIGFRGAVCWGDRINGIVDSKAVKAIKKLL